jgi:hypothetical protein
VGDREYCDENKIFPTPELAEGIRLTGLIPKMAFAVSQKVSQINNQSHIDARIEMI